MYSLALEERKIRKGEISKGAANLLIDVKGRINQIQNKNRFFRKERALTVIREVFSPELETWLGPTPRKELEMME